MPRGDKGNGKAYTPDELLFIRNNADKGVKWLADKLNRSEASITNRAWRLGISTRQKNECRGLKATKLRYAKFGWVNFPKKLGYKTIRKMVMERDNWTCQYCGEPAQEIDHVVPQHMGGHDYPSNLVAACRKCNNAKNAMCVACPEWRKKRFNE